MQRVRISLPYFKKYGWEPTVVSVKPEFVEAPIEDNLLLTIPAEVNVHRVNAFRTSLTRKFGLGSLGFRSMIQIFIKSIFLIKREKFDIIYFSTTAFPVMILGRFFKFMFNIPFVVDIQDPWRPDHYLDKPKHEQPPKFKFAYAINSFLEKFTIPHVSGIIAVSEGYIETLRRRYRLKDDVSTRTITFSASKADFFILNKLNLVANYSLSDEYINIVYIGRGGYDLQYSLNIIFRAFSEGLSKYNDLLKDVRFHFIGTSYAKSGTGKKTIEPLAVKFNIENYVFETTDRIPYFETLALLLEADILLIPGSNEADYTASKLYPYILSEKNILAIFHQSSSVIHILKETNAGKIIEYNLVDDNIDLLTDKTLSFLLDLIKNRDSKPVTNWEVFDKYSATQMTAQQVNVFNEIIS